MNEEGLTPLQTGAILSGIQQVVNLAQANSLVALKNFGVWRNRGWKVENTLKAYQSVDWYLARAKSPEGRFSVNILREDLLNEPWRNNNWHLDIVAMHSNRLTESRGGWFIGCGLAYIGAFISVEPFAPMDDWWQRECIITLTMHEVCHMFYTPCDNRRRDVREDPYEHCPNRCIMRQGIRVPNDWVQMTIDRLNHGPLCPSCQQDLYLYFSSER